MSPLVPMVVEQTVARRARVRHLLAPAQRADRLPRHAGHRRDREPDRRPAAPPRVRGPGQGHLALHQLARRIRLRRASRSTTRCSSSSRDVQTICVGIAMSMGALLLAGGAEGKRMALPEREDPDPPGLLELPGPGHRHRDPRQGDHRRPPPAGRDPGQAHRPGAREGRAATPSATTS